MSLRATIVLIENNSFVPDTEIHTKAISTVNLDSVNDELIRMVYQHFQNRKLNEPTLAVTKQTAMALGISLRKLQYKLKSFREQGLLDPLKMAVNE